MMLSEQIESAISIMEYVHAAKQEEAVSKYTSQTNNTFFSEFEKFSNCMTTYNMLRKKFPEFSVDDETHNKIWDISLLIKKAFAEKKVFKVDSIKKNNTIICDSVSKIWNDYAVSKNQKIIEELTILMQVSDKKKQIREMCTKIDEVKKWPVSEEKLTTYNAAIDASEQLLADTKFDHEIEDFLKMVRDKKATLIDLNPNVLKWLESEGLKDKISLSIKI